MAYSPALGKIVMFGGAGASWPPLNETWLFDGASWKKGPAAPGGLGGRTGAGMVYDDKLGKIVLFGGSGAIPYNDTWLFNGTSWTPGPAAPPELKPRAFFGMAYDPVLQKTLVAGGSGDTKTWYFNGTAWTSGPDMAGGPGPKERVRMAYDPQLSGPVLFGGLGPGSAKQDFWLLRGGAWLQIPGASQNEGWPDIRFDSGLLWHPTKDAIMLFAGIDDENAGVAGFSDAWFFREVPPQVTSVTLRPSTPKPSSTIRLSTGPVTGGYKSWTLEYSWFKNDVLIPGAKGTKLGPSNFQHGDRIQAKVRATDDLEIVGPWVASAQVQVTGQPPTINSATISPSKAYVTSTLTAIANGVNDPDGDVVTLHYSWAVNDVPVASHDLPTLDPSHFAVDDVVTVSIQVVDSEGLVGNTVTSPPVTIDWNLKANSSPIPGKTASVNGAGFGASEQVAIRIDAPTGANLAVFTTDSTGSFPFSPVPIPYPFPGGVHMLFGVGLNSGIVGPGPVLVLPTGDLSLTVLAAGDTTTFSGTGFVPGEGVSVSFPDGQAVVQPANSTGSVAVAIVSPPEPFPGDVVTASAPSGQVTDKYTVKSVFTSPDTAEPMDTVPVTLSGFGPSETVQFSFDGGAPSQQFVTDSRGSLSAGLVLSTTFGSHDISATGTSSWVSKVNHISLPAWMTVSPTKGPVGTVITIDSGPGWIAGEVVHLKWKSEVVKNVTADGNGKVHTTYTVPQNAATQVTVKLTDDILGLSPSATFTVTSGSPGRHDPSSPPGVHVR
jgi:hypothetical protein